MPDTKGAVVAPIPIARPGFLSAARSLISDVSYSTWFGPLQPIPPQAPAGTDPRRFDYPTGINISYVPRAEEAITMDMLRNLAEIWDLLRLVMETRKDQIAGIPWEVRVRKLPNEKNISYRERTKDDPRVRAATAFFKQPDGDHLWQSWIRAVLEDAFVLDALTLYPFRDKQGKLFLDIIDGATIKRLIDPEGRTPMPPDPAYQQIIKGVPGHSFTRDQILYRPKNPRSWRIYGLSPVEQIVLTISLATRRQMWKLNYYTVGSIPEAIAQVPDTWPPDRIKQFQEWWDAMLAGQLDRRRQVLFVPGFGGKDAITFPKQDAIKDEMDEWLARVVCYAFSVSPQPFIKEGMSRFGVQQQAQMAKAEGLLPTLSWLKEIFDDVLEKFGWGDLEFNFNEEEEADLLKRAQIQETQVKSGLRRFDEVREDNGDEPYGVGAGIVTATGFVAFPGEPGSTVPPTPPPGSFPPGGHGAPTNGNGKEPDKLAPPKTPEAGKAAGGHHAFHTRSQQMRHADLAQRIETYLAQSREEAVKRLLTAYKPHAPPPDGNGRVPVRKQRPEDPPPQGGDEPPQPPVVPSPDPIASAVALVKATADAMRLRETTPEPMPVELDARLLGIEDALADLRKLVPNYDAEQVRAAVAGALQALPASVTKEEVATLFAESRPASPDVSAVVDKLAGAIVEALKGMPVPPAPVVNVTTPEHPAPVVNITAPPAVVHVPEPNVHITTAEPVVNVNVPPQPATAVTVQPAPVTIVKQTTRQKRPKVQVDVHVPRRGRVVKTVKRDVQGEVKQIIEEEEPPTP